MNAIAYKAVIEKAFQYLDIFGSIPWTCEHDNAPIHTARAVKQWISGRNVYFPDLNIIENVWGLLSRKVYEGGIQFGHTAILIVVIKKSWATTSICVLENHYNSLKNRIFDVIVNKGGSTKY